MAQRPRRPSSRPSRRTTRRRSSRPVQQNTDPDLLSDVGDALDADHPIELLAQVSSLLAAVDPRARSPFEREPDPEVPTLAMLLSVFFGIEARETSALLAVIGGLSADETLRLRVHRELYNRDSPLPRWLLELPQTTPAPRVVEVVHALGDGDNVLVGARLPGGAEITAVIYLDHNAGAVVKDAFVVPLPIDELVDQMLVVADDPDTEARDIAPADARARITEGIADGALTYPPYESDSWPASRPLVEWITAMLPVGGVGYRRPDWGDAALAELAERFLAAGPGAGFDDPDHHGLLDWLLLFGTDHGPGDPLTWSPTRVEILLLDWIPRKIVAEPRLLAMVPDLLRALIRFGHRERGISAGPTAETLGAVDRFEPEYQRSVRSPRTAGPQALLAAMGLADGPIEESELLLDDLARAVGGRQPLDTLDTAPLPAEDFCWGGIPQDVRERVGEVLGLVDDCCEALLDGEYRTACRRLLARAAAANPGIFRRRSRADTTAATVCWVIGKANELFDPHSEPHLLVKALVAHFGLRQIPFSQRSAPFLTAVGAAAMDEYGAIDLGSPDYLTAARRASIIAERDHYRPNTT